MAIKYIQHDYYDVLDQTQNSEFERKQTRVYLDIHNLRYKGQSVSVAVPLRANINKNFQRSPNEIIPTDITEHTRPGFIAGWHITKMIPYDPNLFYESHATTSESVQSAEKVAHIYMKKIKKNAQELLEKFEKGETVFGSIEFDKALQSMRTLINEKQISKLDPTLVAATKTTEEQ